MLHFEQHSIRHEDTTVKFGEKFRMSEEDEVIERTGISNNNQACGCLSLAKRRSWVAMSFSNSSIV